MKNVRSHLIVFILAVGGFFLAVLNFSGQFNPFAALNFDSNNQPLFSSLDQFVLVAEKKIELTDNIQVSSGDLASNEEIRIRENNIVNGNLFSDEISIEATSTINGNVSFNELEIDLASQILGTTSTPISLPIIKLPAIPDFPTGNQRLLINQTSTISPGNFDEIKVQENIALTLISGVYNLNKLELSNNSKLLFSALTTLNIREDLDIRDKVLISQTTNIPSTDLQINVKEDKDIDIGQNSLISFKLLAPNSQVNFGERITFRGQILAKEIKVGENSVLSREDGFIKGSDLKAIVIATDGSKFPINEIMVNFTDFATISDAQRIANFVNGRIVGFVEIANVYQIEVTVADINELKAKIQAIRNINNPLIEGVFRNFILDIF